MAGRKTNRAGSVSAKSRQNRSTTKKTGQGKGRSNKRSYYDKDTEGNGIGSLLVSLFVDTYFGRVFIGFIIFALVILINLLLSQNRFDIFFLILGIEIIVASIVGWLIFLLKDDRE